MQFPNTVESSNVKKCIPIVKSVYRSIFIIDLLESIKIENAFLKITVYRIRVKYKR